MLVSFRKLSQGTTRCECNRFQQLTTVNFPRHFGTPFFPTLLSLSLLPLPRPHRPRTTRRISSHVTTPVWKMHILPVRAAFVPLYNWPPCPLPPSASPLLALRSVGWMLSAVCALLHPQWGTSRFLFFFPESDSIEINREDPLSDPFIQPFHYSFQVDADAFAFSAAWEAEGRGILKPVLPGLCKQVFPSPPAVHRGLLPPVNVHRLALPSFLVSGHVVQLGGRRTTACTDRAGWLVFVVMPGEWECLGGTPSLLWRWTGRFYRSTLTSFPDDAADDNWNTSCLMNKRTASAI